MNRFLFIVVLIVACVAGLGFYQGWFHIGSDSSDGKTHVTFTLDQNKIKADENKALEKVHGTGHQGTDPAAPVEPPQNGK
jgi:hypothetical protein